MPLKVIIFKDNSSPPNIFIVIPNFQQDICENWQANSKNYMKKQVARETNTFSSE